MGSGGSGNTGGGGNQASHSPGGTGYGGGGVGAQGNAGEMSGGAGGAGMAGFGGGGIAGVANSGWGGPGGSAGPAVGYGSGFGPAYANPSNYTNTGAYKNDTNTNSLYGQLHAAQEAAAGAQAPASTNFAGTEGWGPTMGGGSGYGGDLGGLGTAGTMSGGAGGAGMSGYGGGGQAGISGSGWGGPMGSAGAQGSGGAAGFSGGVSRPSVSAPQRFSQSLPTVTTGLVTPKTVFGVLGTPPRAGYAPYGINPSQVNPGYGYSPGMKGPFSVGGNNTAQGYQGVNPGLRDRMGGGNLPSVSRGPQGYSGGAYGNTRGPVGGRRM